MRPLPSGWLLTTGDSGPIVRQFRPKSGAARPLDSCLMTLFERNQRATCALHADLLQLQTHVAQAVQQGKPIENLSLIFHQHDFAVTYETSADSKHCYIECRLLHAAGSLLSSGLVIADGVDHYEGMMIARNTVAGLV